MIIVLQITVSKKGNINRATPDRKRKLGKRKNKPFTFDGRTMQRTGGAPRLQIGKRKGKKYI